MDPSYAVSDPSPLPRREWRPSSFGRLAREYATRFHLAVLPLLVDGDAPVLCAVPRGPADASRDPGVIQAWWTRAPRANVGIACAASGLLVLEVDLRGGGPETLAMHAERLGPLPSTWTAQTLEGWAQIFFSHADPDVAALAVLRPLGPGVKVTHRGSVLAAPSVCGGRRTAWWFDRRPGRAPLAAMPRAWLDRLTGRRLPAGDLSGLDARHTILGRVFDALGWLGPKLDDGRRIARCPWAGEHASPGGADGAHGDEATVLSSPEGDPTRGAFACRHAECAHRQVVDLLEALPAEALQAARGALRDVGRSDFVDVDDELRVLVERGSLPNGASRATRAFLSALGVDLAAEDA